MASGALPHERGERPRVGPATDGQELTGLATEQLLAGFETVATVTATAASIPRVKPPQGNGKRQTAGGRKSPNTPEPRLGGSGVSTKSRNEPDSEMVEGPYSRPLSSCNRHSRRKSGSQTRLKGGIKEDNNKPKALVDTEMEMALAGGSKLAMKAMRAVQQANAQVYHANLEAARKEISLGVERKKFKRLEADMFRSRVELAEALCDMERGQQVHAGEMEQAEKRVKELEDALRAADEVLRLLTAEMKRKRSDAENQETSLRARLADLERRLEASEREGRHQKLSTWRTIARETERAAGRERYRMTAFLQRYVLENEFLRTSRAKAEESLSDLSERLRQTEEDLAKARAASLATLRGRKTLVGVVHTSMIARGELNRGVRDGRGGVDAGGSSHITGVCEQGRGGEGEREGRQEGQAGAAGNVSSQPRSSNVGVDAATTQAEMPIRRIKGQAEAHARHSGSLKNVDGCGDTNGDDDRWRGNGWGRGERGGQRSASVHVRGELRFMRGLVGELSTLLLATESERDSLASLLVLAEQRMDRLVVSQEELALTLAWGNVSRMEEHQLRQLKQHQRLEIDSEASKVTATGANASKERQPEKNEGLLAPLVPDESSGNDDGCLPDDQLREAVRPAVLDTATTFEQSRAALQSLELKRRVRELEVLITATEAGAREVEQENRRLRSCRGNAPPWMSWERGAGVVGSTANSSRYHRRSGTSTSSASTPRSDQKNRRLAEDETSRGATPVKRDRRRRQRRRSQEDTNSNDGAGYGLGEWDSGLDKNSSGSNAEREHPSVSLPTLSAAEVGRGDEIARACAGGETAAPSVVEESAARKGSLSHPTAWGWTGKDDSTARPEGRCRPRSSPFSTRERRNSSWEEHCASVGGSSDDGSSLIKGQLAWVLGLPVEATTETQLVAEVMHLVAERGNANTDAKALEAQLGRMDEQSLSLTRLAASVAGAVTSQGGNGGSGSPDYVSVPHASLVGLDGIGDATAAGARERAGSKARGRRRTSRSTIGRPSTSGLESASVAATSHHGEPEQEVPLAETALVAQQQAVLGRGGQVEKTEDSGRQQSLTETETDDRGQNSGTTNVATGSPAAAEVERSLGVAGESGESKKGETFDENTIRTTFAKTIHGSVVSIDILCTKILSETERKQAEGRGKAHERRMSMDDFDYEIRVEAYDPAVLKHHVLHIQAEHIKACMSAHPHLYTLGPHRAQVQQSLAERLMLMSEDDVRAEQIKQGRVGGTGAASSGDGGAGSMAKTSAVLRTSWVASAGNPGGGAVRGGGEQGEGVWGVGVSGARAKRGEEPSRLLVLMGDNGEIVTAEKKLAAENTEGDVGAEVARIKRVHRSDKDPLLQLEEDVVQGTVYQDEPPIIREPMDPEHAEVAARLLAVESVASSEEGDGAGDSDSDDDDDRDSGYDEYKSSDDDDDDDDESDSSEEEERMRRAIRASKGS